MIQFVFLCSKLSNICVTNTFYYFLSIEVPYMIFLCAEETCYVELMAILLYNL